MTKLARLYEEQGQSPWLDDLKRAWLNDGRLASFVDDGIRGITANPTIFAKAISGSDDYDAQFARLIASGCDTRAVYWELVLSDISAALAMLRPLYDASDGMDGFVSVELEPEIAHDTAASIAAARQLHDRVAAPNLFVKIPATEEGVPAVEAMIAEGRNINITLLFSLDRYDQVIEAYLRGLEAFPGDLAAVHSVASFFVSRVDTEVDCRLEKIGTERALALRGCAGIAQAKLAYRLFRERFSGGRWDRLASRSAKLQRPLWASTSTKNPALPDTFYVDGLIGPDTVNTMPEATIEAFEDHGTLSSTVDVGLDEARQVMEELEAIGVDMADVGCTLESDGVASFAKSFEELLQGFETKTRRAGAT